MVYTTNSEEKTPAWHRAVRPRVWRTTAISCVLLPIGLIAYRHTPTQWWGILVLFIAALVIGENLELKVSHRPTVPVSFALVMALSRTTTNEGNFSWIHASIVIVASVAISSACHFHIAPISRAKFALSRLVIYFVGVFTAHTIFIHVDPTTQWLYAGLIISLLTMLGVHEILAWLDHYPRIYGFFAVIAHGSVIAGGVLVGVGYAGTKDLAVQTTLPEASGNGLGVSALITCAIPLLVAWFAFSRYYGALRTYRQTIRALSAAPELGGIVAWGHADRVARIALAVADKLDIDRDLQQQIETAAYMHTLGDAVLDTTMEVDLYEEAEAARVTADIVRSAGGLDRVADIIDEHVKPYRGVVDGNLVAQNDIAASVLRVANDYDNISRREETWGIRALAAMMESPTATYNPRALDALEWVISRERYADLIDPPSMPQDVYDRVYAS